MFHFHQFKENQPFLNNSIGIKGLSLSQLKQSSNINIAQSQSFNRNNQREASYRSNDDNNQYNYDDYTDILNAGIISNITKGNFACIEDFLDKMLNMHIEAEPHVSDIISSFQILLSHLFNQQSIIYETNNIIETQINQSHPSVIDSRITRNKTIISSQQKVLNELNKRQSTLKNVIITNGQESKLVPPNIPIPKVIYVCDVCKDKKFKVYDAFHAHYVKNHIRRGDDENQLHEFETKYFDKKMKDITEELRGTMMNKEYDDLNMDEYKMNDYEEDEEKLRELGSVAQLDRGTIKINVKSQKKGNEESLKNSSISVEKEDLELLQVFKQMRKKQDDEYDIIRRDIKQFEMDLMKYIKDISNQ